MDISVHCRSCMMELELDIDRTPQETIREHNWNILPNDTPVCSDCFSRYSTVAGILGNKKINKDAVICKECGFVALNQHGHNTHYSKIHGMRFKPKSEKKKSSEKKKRRSTPRTCEECGRVCLSPQGLGSHKLRVHNIRGTSPLAIKTREEKFERGEKEYKMTSYKVYVCRWFDMLTECNRKGQYGHKHGDYCNTVDSVSNSGHKRLLDHERVCHASKYSVARGISRQKRRQEYRSKKIYKT